MPWVRCFVVSSDIETPLSTLFTTVLQDPPLPWVTADRRILNPAIHVGTQLDKLVQGGQALQCIACIIQDDRGICSHTCAFLHVVQV
jgi:hypothetical protein